MRVGTNLDTGQAWEIDLRRLFNMVAGGRSGSGKSSMLYILAANALANPAVRFCTVDKDGALSAHLPESPLRWSGLTPINEGVETLENIVQEMDSRLALLREYRRDKFDFFAPDFPLYTVVIDELAGLFANLAIFDQAEGLKGKASMETRARVLVGRLMAEGRKAGFRTILATQKPTIQVFSDGIRENAGCAVSFANEPGAVKLLIPSASSEDCESLGKQPSGVCLVRDQSGVFLAKSDLMTHEAFKQVIENNEGG